MSELDGVRQVMGLAGYALAVAAGAAALVWWLVGPRRGRRLFAGIAALVLVGAVAGLRAEGIPLGGFLRGMAGDLSITAMAMVVAALLATLTGRTPLDAPSRTALLAFAAGAGAVLYPLTLGLSQLDPYELGYRPRTLLVVIAALVAWWWWRRRGAAVVLASGVVAFNLGVLESVNLWDYLLDPVLVISSWGALAWRAARALVARRADALTDARWPPVSVAEPPIARPERARDPGRPSPAPGSAREAAASRGPGS